MPPDDSTVRLHWHGPLAIPHLDAWRSSYGDVQRSHVYVYLQDYGAKLVAYVGRADNFIRRLQEHLCGFLGLSYWLRDSAGEPVYKAGIEEKLERFDDLDGIAPVAVEETRRVRFLYARCEPGRSKAVESALIHRLMGRADAEEEPGLECDNSRREYHGFDRPRMVVESRADSASPEAARYLRRLFGDAPIEWGRRGE